VTRWTVIHLATGAAAEVAAAATAPHAARRSRLPLDRDGAIERIGPDDWEGRGVRVHRVRARSGAPSRRDGSVRVNLWLSGDAATEATALAKEHGGVTAGITAALLASRARRTP
jgi:hypothetical protein